MAVDTVTSYAKTVPLIKEGLNEPYSPNHAAGLTTTEHIFRQLEMMALLEVDIPDYERLASLVSNPNVGPDMQVRPEDLAELVGPLRAVLTSSDWKVLAAVGAFHDSGKVSPSWASASGLCLDDVEWIAHDFDSEIILANNPGLLEPLGLAPAEYDLVLRLCRLHSLPGQFFFGEGRMAAYRAVAGISENALKVARLQGILDVASALNHRFVRPILSSHATLSRQVDLGLEGLNERVARQELGSKYDWTRFRMGPVATHRLTRLTGLPVEKLEALTELDDAALAAFHEATDGPRTWFGTYVANAFGSGLIRALGDESVAVEAMVRVVGCAALCYGGARQEWALSALQPALAIVGDREVALRLVEEARHLKDPQAGAEMLLAGSRPLRCRVGSTGVALEYRP